MITINEIASIYPILEAVANSTGLDIQQIKNDRGRNIRVTTARKLAMYLVREELKLSYYKLAEYFDRDHTTCWGNCRSIAKKVKTRPRGALAKIINEIRVTIMADKLLRDSRQPEADFSPEDNGTYLINTPIGFRTNGAEEVIHIDPGRWLLRYEGNVCVGVTEWKI